MTASPTGAARPGLSAIIIVAGSTGVLGWLVLYGGWFRAPLALALSLVPLGVIPAVAARSWLRWGWSGVGLGPGVAKLGVVLLVPGLALAGLAGWLGADSPQLVAEYPLDRDLSPEVGPFALYALLYLLYYVGFEFLFRGYLLLGLADRLGPNRANLLQTVLAVLFHVGKPLAEIGAALPASLVFGWVALRTRSIWYVVLIHWAVGISLDWFILRGP